MTVEATETQGKSHERDSEKMDNLGSICLWITVAAALVLCFEATKFMSWYAVRDYLLEWREFGLMYSTDLLLQGKNPYALGLQPVAINPYGLLYNLTVLPLAWIFGFGPIVHRIVSCAFIILSCACLFWGMKKSGVSLPLAFIGTAVFYGHSATSMEITARPDSMGQFFFIASIVLPMLYAFRPRALVASGVLALLAFSAKTYFFFGAPLLALYIFLFENKLKGVWYGLGTGIGLVALIVLTNELCETYVINTLLLMIGSLADSGTHLRMNLLRYATTQLGFLVSFFWAYGFVVGSRSPVAQLPSLPTINLRPLNGPLIDARVSVPAFMTVCALAIIMGKMGWNTGQAQLYYHQLLTPFLMWWIVATLDRVAVKRWWIVLAPPIAINLVLMWSFFLFVEYETPLYVDRSAEWKALERVMETHNDVFQQSALAYLAAKHDKPIYDTGWHEYFPNIEKYASLKLTLPYLDQCRDFRSRLMEKVTEGKFDLVLQGTGVAELVPSNVLKKNYHIAGHMSVPLPFFNQKGTAIVRVWEPNRKP